MKLRILACKLAVSRKLVVSQAYHVGMERTQGVDFRLRYSSRGLRGHCRSSSSRASNNCSTCSLLSCEAALYPTR